MANIITPDGPPATTQGGTIYIKRFGDWSPFVWGGECVYIGDITDERGGLNVTTRANAREGGLQRDGVLVDPPGNVSTTLSMKRIQRDRLKTQLRSCFWLFDKRTQCSEFDDSTAWIEIERVYRAKVGTRTTTPGTSIMDANAEDMVNFDITALEDCDIYRLNLEQATLAEVPDYEGGVAIDLSAALTITCVDTCHSERCINCGNAETDAVFVAGTIDDGGASPYILVNEDNGDPDGWQAIDVAEWDTYDISDIVCLGAWGAVVSNTAAAGLVGQGVLWTRDRFDTRVQLTDADLETYPPNCIDASTQTFVVIGADDGRIFLSRDSLSTVDIVLAGTIGAGTEDITEIEIAPSNRLVVYGASEDDDFIVKTENGGETWFQLTLTGTTGGITALAVHPDDSNMVLVGTDQGEIYQTTDGGETWTLQADLPNILDPDDVTISDIKAAGCGVWFLAMTESARTSRVYINHSDGASGEWTFENVIDGTTYELDETPTQLATAGPNRCVVVGGTAANMVGLLA